MTDDPLRMLAGPARQALVTAGIETLDQLALWKRADVAKLDGMGPHAMTTLDASLRVRRMAWTQAGPDLTR